jgi:predicted DNA-binding transcriptional regulator YafY
MRFERPADFDALGHLVFSVATIPRAFAVEVLLKTDLPRARRELFATIGVLEPADGGVVLRGQTDDLDWFARELARLPFDFEIRHPAALREALRVRARALLARAAGTTPPVSRRR